MKTNKIKKLPTTSAYEKKQYYFNQFWAFYNPEMLRQGKLTILLEKEWNEIWDKIPDNIENKIKLVNRKYIFSLF